MFSDKNCTEFLHLTRLKYGVKEIETIINTFEIKKQLWELYRALRYLQLAFDVVLLDKNPLYINLKVYNNRT